MDGSHGECFFVPLYRSLIFHLSQGLDLDKLVSQKRFLFLDGLTGLYLPNQQAPHESSDQDKILENPTLSGVAGEIQIAVKLLHSGIPGSKTILIIDQMDLLLATGGNKITPVNLEEMLLGLRHVCSLPFS